MARIKYYYDTETCKYERVKVTKWDITLNLLGFLSVALVMAMGILFILGKYFDSPKEASLKKENEELKLYYEVLNKELDKMEAMGTSLAERDDDIYRVIFEVDRIPASVREAGIGGTERYKQILEQGLQQEELILGTTQRIDQIKRKMFVQTKSYDEIVELAKKKTDYLASVPAIQPISNKELTRLASGFGMRIHPILKIRKMHTGYDFTAPQGTPIYATGDGKVIRVKTNYTGYGKEVEIDHGFGYITKYAHMSAFNVNVGQTVKRGDPIGFVGNTGSSTAPHLHYEVIKDGKKVNPGKYVYKDLSAEEYEKLLEIASRENQSLGY
ncbi:M23 family metallopeptidase [Fulvivirgaceae bacterium BMA10]|uniref:M23 family metallopeptidase n=1 Tax=Splendidivirga corallicola TaxID=3051826 RepID=A0ABT8KGE2_9BACT|nr:M23 family metallopeptidase [Fulvivirgaceae bacterium BMA10]